MAKAKTVTLVHISKTRCWTCRNLQKNMYMEGYRCIQNKYLPDMLPPWFGEKCTHYVCKEREW